MVQRMIGFLIVVFCFVFSFCSTSIAAPSRCTGAISRITELHSLGNIGVAKLLVDSAIGDPVSIGCSPGQYTQLRALRDSVYLECIIKQLDDARADVLERDDGLAALEGIRKAVFMAHVIDVSLEGINKLFGFAYFVAAAQTLEMANEAKHEGDFENAEYLIRKTVDFLEKARMLDDRIDAIMRNNGLTK